MHEGKPHGACGRKIRKHRQFRLEAKLVALCHVRLGEGREQFAPLLCELDAPQVEHHREQRDERKIQNRRADDVQRLADAPFSPARAVQHVELVGVHEGRVTEDQDQWEEEQQFVVVRHVQKREDPGG